jgi:hypothetical protein
MIQTVCGCSSRVPLVLTDETLGQVIACPLSGMSFRVERARPFGAAEWRDCREPELLRQCLEQLGYRFRPRKRRLLACACCRRHWHRLPDERSRSAVEVAERYADGTASRRQLRAVWEEANTAAEAAPYGSPEATWGRIAASCAEEPVPRTWPFRDLHGVEAGPLVELVRDLLGNPFQPLAPRPFPAAVVGLAQEANAGDHALFPVLADALADLGEDEASAHCRQPAHVLGCHVVDWVLDKA